MGQLMGVLGGSWRCAASRGPLPLPCPPVPAHHLTFPSAACDWATLQKTKRRAGQRLERGRAAQLERINKLEQIGKALKEGACVRVVAIAKREMAG